MSRRRLFRDWHRWLGIGVTGFLVLLVATGVALNHSSFLRLNDTNIQSGWLLDWYGISGLNESAFSYRIDDRWATAGNGWIFLDTMPVASGLDEIVGVVKTTSLIVAASQNEILLFSPDGELVERYFPAFASGPITALGLADGNAVLAIGERQFRADDNVADWSGFTGQVVWPESSAVPAYLRSDLNRHLRGDGLPLYRILLDLHSGRFFADQGPLFVDMVALTLIILNFLGLWLWWSRR